MLEIWNEFLFPVIELAIVLGCVLAICGMFKLVWWILDLMDLID